MKSRRGYPLPMLLALSLILWAPSTVARAEAPPPIFDTMEFMMHTIAADGQLLGRVYGEDLTPLHFTGQLDPGVSFSYAFDEGAIYAGLPLTLSGTGLFADATWSGSSTGQLGTASWTSTWDGQIVSSVPWQMQMSWLSPAPATSRVQYSVDISVSGGPGVTQATYTFDEDGVVVGSVTVPDYTFVSYDGFGLEFEPGTCTLDPPVYLAEVGTCVPDTGEFEGYLIVPEPATLVSLLLGAGFCLCRRR